LGGGGGGGGEGLFLNDSAAALAEPPEATDPSARWQRQAQLELAQAYAEWLRLKGAARLIDAADVSAAALRLCEGFGAQVRGQLRRDGGRLGYVLLPDAHNAGPTTVRMLRALFGAPAGAPAGAQAVRAAGPTDAAPFVAGPSGPGGVVDLFVDPSRGVSFGPAGSALVYRAWEAVAAREGWNPAAAGGGGAGPDSTPYAWRITHTDEASSTSPPILVASARKIDAASLFGPSHAHSFSEEPFAAPSGPALPAAMAQGWKTSLSGAAFPAARLVTLHPSLDASKTGAAATAAAVAHTADSSGSPLLDSLTDALRTLPHAVYVQSLSAPAAAPVTSVGAKGEPDPEAFVACVGADPSIDVGTAAVDAVAALLVAHGRQGTSPGTVGVLARSLNQARTVVVALRDRLPAALARLGAGAGSDAPSPPLPPILCDHSAKLADVAEVRLALAFLGVLAKPADARLLYAVAASPYYSAPHLELGALLQRAKLERTDGLAGQLRALVAAASSAASAAENTAARSEKVGGLRGSRECSASAGELMLALQEASAATQAQADALDTDTSVLAKKRAKRTEAAAVAAAAVESTEAAAVAEPEMPSDPSAAAAVVPETASLVKSGAGGKPLVPSAAMLSAARRLVADIDAATRVYTRTGSTAATLAVFLRRSGIAQQLANPTESTAESAAEALAALLRLVFDVEAGEASSSVAFGAGAGARRFSRSHASSPRLRAAGRGADEPFGPIQGLPFVHDFLEEVVLEDGLMFRADGSATAFDSASDPAEAVATDADSPLAGNRGAVSIAARLEHSLDEEGATAVKTVEETLGSALAIQSAAVSASDAADATVAVNILDALDRTPKATLADRTLGTVVNPVSVPLGASNPSIPPAIVVTTYLRGLDHHFDSLVFPWLLDSTLPGAMSPMSAVPMPAALFRLPEDLERRVQEALREDAAAAASQPQPAPVSVLPPPVLSPAPAPAVVAALPEPEHDPLDPFAELHPFSPAGTGFGSGLGEPAGLGSAPSTSSRGLVSISETYAGPHMDFQSIMGTSKYAKSTGKHATGNAEIDLPSLLLKAANRAEHIERQRRIFSVLLTHARKNVIFVVGSRLIDRPNTLLRRSRFLDELFGASPAFFATDISPLPKPPRAPSVPPAAGQPGTGADSAGRASTLSATSGLMAASPPAAVDSNAAVPTTATMETPSALVSTKKKTKLPMLSYSKLFEYESCPYRYYLSRVVQVPQMSAAPLLYGKSLHAAVEQSGGLLRSLVGSAIGLDTPGADGTSSVPVDARIAATGQLIAEIRSCSDTGKQQAAAILAGLPDPATVARAMEEAYLEAWHNVDSPVFFKSNDDEMTALVKRHAAQAEHAEALANIPLAQADDLREEARAAIASWIGREIEPLRRRLQAAVKGNTPTTYSNLKPLSLPVLIEHMFTVPLLQFGTSLIGVIDRVDVIERLDASAHPALSKYAYAYASRLKAAKGAAKEDAASAAPTPAVSDLVIREFKTAMQWRSPGYLSKQGRGSHQVGTYALALRYIGGTPKQKSMSGSNTTPSAGNAAVAPTSTRQMVSFESIETGETLRLNVGYKEQQSVITALGRMTKALSEEQYGPTPSPMKCSVCPFHAICPNAYGLSRPVADSGPGGWSDGNEIEGMSMLQ
jgi:hypothetical protein